MHSSHPTETTSGKLLGLEILRFCAAFAVLVWHYQHFWYLGDKPIGLVREEQPFYAGLGFFYDWGFQGVQVFWCISGFIFFWKYAKVIPGGEISATRFFVLRFSRLYPIHFLFLIVTAVLQLVYLQRTGHYFVYQANDLRHFVLQLFLASHWGFQEASSFNGPIWSISLEVLVYALFFAAMRADRKTLRATFVVLAVCLVARKLRFHSDILDCVAYFFIGGLSAEIFKATQSSRWRLGCSATAIALAVLAPVLVAGFGWHRSGRFTELVLVVYVPLLLYIAAHDLPLKGRALSIVETAGNMTYASYLFQFPFQLALMTFFSFTGTQVPRASGVFFVFFIGSTLLASAWLYRRFEMPMQALIRRRFSASRAARQNAGVPSR